MSHTVTILKKNTTSFLMSMNQQIPNIAINEQTWPITGGKLQQETVFTLHLLFLLTRKIDKLLPDFYNTNTLHLLLLSSVSFHDRDQAPVRFPLHTNNRRKFKLV
jgi:hypothetical protein